MDPNEQVLCVPRTVFEQTGLFQGFSSEWEKYVHSFLQSDVALFLPRGECETDPSYKQIIPYVMFHWERPGRDVWLRYTRTKQSGEGRLRGKASVGIGGHINPTDGKSALKLPEEDKLLTIPMDSFISGYRREVNEEVRIDATTSIRHVGVVNDDSDPIGEVHFGFMMEINLSLPCVYPADETTQEMYFESRQQLVDDIEEFEGWSQICIKVLGAKAPCRPKG